MAVCALAKQQTDGSYVLVFDDTQTDTSSCAYVVLTAGDYSSAQFTSMSIQDATTVSVAVGCLWAVAWVFRALAKSMSTKDEEYE